MLQRMGLSLEAATEVTSVDGTLNITCNSKTKMSKPYAVLYVDLGGPTQP